MSEGGRKSRLRFQFLARIPAKLARRRPSREGPTAGLYDFLNCFSQFEQRNKNAEDKHSQELSVVDFNGDGMISTHEFERWIKQKLVSFYSGAKGVGLERASKFWRMFHSSYAFAFNMVAKKCGTTDDCIKTEHFRLLISHLCLVVKMHDAFLVLYDESEENSINSDQRISARNWKDGCNRVSRYNFVALNDANVDDPSAFFSGMLEGDAQEVLLEKWCSFLARREVEAGTEMGNEFGSIEVCQNLNQIGNIQKKAAKKKSLVAVTMSNSIGLSYDAYNFVDVFVELGGITDIAKKMREKEWAQIDFNGNGIVSLAEFDCWIRHKLVAAYKVDRGNHLWKTFRPCYILAFGSAKDLSPTKSLNGDDFVSKVEFRALNIFLCIISNMLDAFRLIDNNKVCGNEAFDWRMSRTEWIEGYKKVVNHGFVALDDVSDPPKIFDEMLSNSNSEVLLRDWCLYLALVEVESKTGFGNFLELNHYLASPEKSSMWNNSTSVSTENLMSITMQPLSNQTLFVYEFIDCFVRFGEAGEVARESRTQVWTSIDQNSDDLLSLAEVDHWIKQNLVKSLGSNRGNDIWRKFRPCYSQAFDQAKDLAPTQKIAGSCETTDDYISKTEFKTLNAYLCIFASMLDAFYIISNGFEDGVIGNSHQLSRNDWLKGYKKISKHGFLALTGIADPSSIFSAMSSDEAQDVVLYSDWCFYLRRIEVDNSTKIGHLLENVKSGSVRKQGSSAICVDASFTSLLMPHCSSYGMSTEAYDFVDCFVLLGESNQMHNNGKILRLREWNRIDKNANGLVSLAEADLWIKEILVEKHKIERGVEIWRKFRSSTIVAFNIAKSLASTVGVRCLSDDYISRTEFRLFIAYLCISAEMLDAFALITESYSGHVSGDDRRMSLDKWMEGYKIVSGHGFVALNNISDPRAVFSAMKPEHNSDSILLQEWCSYLAQKEVESKSERGKLLEKKHKIVNSSPLKKAESISSNNGSLCSAALQLLDGPSFDVHDFIHVFVHLGETGAKELRKKEWVEIDFNGNSYVSLAEFDRWIKHKLIKFYKADRGNDLWRLFRPCYILAFSTAMDLDPINDGYVRWNEFRALITCLCIASTMLDAFHLIDKCGGDIDRKISKEEWLEGYKKVSSHGFIALAEISEPEKLFEDILPDGNEKMLYGDWFLYLAVAEVKSNTKIGTVLNLNSNDNFTSIEKAKSWKKSLSRPTENSLVSLTLTLCNGPSTDVYDFLESFVDFGGKNDTGKRLREKEWLSVDPNGNNFVSLAEFDRWVKQVLNNRPNIGYDRGDQLWRMFRPCYIYAFNEAKSKAPAIAIAGCKNANSDDYVSKIEFRILNVYLGTYATMLDAFYLIDSDGDDFAFDSQINRDEWIARHEKVLHHGFSAFSDFTSAEEVWSSMLPDLSRKIVLGDWIKFLKDAEISNDTGIGRLFTGVFDSAREKRVSSYRINKSGSIIQEDDDEYS